MNEHDALERRLSAWMREAASEPQLVGRFDLAITASTRGRPLPRWRARFGIDWVGTSQRGPAVPAWPLLRAWPAVLLVLALLVAAVILGALAAGARLTVPAQWQLGGLAYAANGDIFVAKADGNSPVRIADGDATGPGPEYSSSRWSPDGRYLLFEANASAVVVTDAAGRRLGSFVGQSPMWAPDSSRIATVSLDASTDQVPASYSLDVHAVDGRLLDSIAIPDFPSGFGELGWTPDGDAIVALPWLLALDGSPPQPFASGVAAPGGYAAFSPDGSRVAIVATHGLYVVASDGTGARLLAPLPPPRESDGYAYPVWSPDGHRIAVWKLGVGDRSGAGLEVIDAVTGDARTIVPVTHPGPGIPRWSPDGSRLLALVPGPGIFFSLASVAADGSGDEAILVDALSLTTPPSGDWRWIRVSTPGPTPAATFTLPSPTSVSR
jgi:Tol biopolymer transport system component